MLKMENAEGDGVEQPKNGVRSSPQRSASGTFSYAFPTSQNITFEETDGEGHPTLMEMMTDELRRQSLLTAMMSLLNRPTLEEIVTIGEEMRAEQTKNLQPVALNKGS
ncbi:hypothetical protein DPX39_080047900 [Trypanosoma brucei equiperdum]|nr:hypothetical protein DPX39_080047900 [Trypanosoma brucei equiperdum]